MDSGGDELARAWLGATVQPVDASLAPTLGLRLPGGVLVSQVYPQGPAARAGLVAGDVVLAVDGAEVLDPRGLNFRLAVGALGEDAELDIWRRGERMKMRLALETPPYDPPPQVTTLSGLHALSGATVANMSPGLNEELRIRPVQAGRGRDGGRTAAAMRHGCASGAATSSPRLTGERVESVERLSTLVHERSLPWELEVERGGRMLAVVIN